MRCADVQCRLPRMNYPPYDIAGGPFLRQRQTLPPQPPTSYSQPYPSYALVPYASNSPDPGGIPRWDDQGQSHPFSNTNPGNDLEAFNPQDHTAVSPSTFNPNTFSSSFVVPRFVSGADSNPFSDGSARGHNLRNQSFEDARGGQGQGQDGRDVPMIGTSASGGYNSGPYPPRAREDQDLRGYSYPSQPERGYGVPPTQAAVASRRRMTPPSPYSPTFSTVSSIFPSREPTAPQKAPQPQRSPPERQAPPRQLHPPPPPPPLSSSKSPVYDLYGSSYISIEPALGALKLAPSTSFPGLASSPLPVFNPEALGLPLPPPQDAGDKNWKGLYSTSGMDMVGILARVAARPRPQISIGPVDLGCSFLVVDARRFDFPIVYASETFSILTGFVLSPLSFRSLPHSLIRCAM